MSCLICILIPVYLYLGGVSAHTPLGSKTPIVKVVLLTKVVIGGITNDRIH